MTYRRVAVVLLAAVVSIYFVGCGRNPESAPPAAAAPQAAAPAAEPEATPAAPPDATALVANVPYAEDLEAFRQKIATATPLLDTYPTDANQLVTYTSPDGSFVVSALGAAIWKGDRAQVEAYVKSGADLTSPIWYAGDTVIQRSFAAHMAIVAVYLKRAEPDYLKFILDQGADANAMETRYGQTRTEMVYSSESVLNHTVTSEIPELTKIVLEAGVEDMTNGATTDKGAKSSPLMAAVLRGNAGAVKLLVDAGVDRTVGAQGADGANKRPVDFAKGYLARNPAPDMAKRLTEIVALLDTDAPPSP